MGKFGANVRKIGLSYALKEAFEDAYLNAKLKAADREYEYRVKRAKEIREKAEKKAAKEAEKAATKAKKDDKTPEQQPEKAEATKEAEKPAEKAVKEEIIKSPEQPEKAETAEAEKATDEEVAESSPVESDTPVILEESDINEIIVGCQSAYNEINPAIIRSVTAAMLYASCNILIENFYKTIGESDKNNMVLANSLINEWTGLPLNGMYPSNQIFEIVDPGQLANIASYVAGLDRFAESAIIQTLADKTRTLITEHDRKKQQEEGVENPDPIVPVMFVGNNIIRPEEDVALTKHEKSMLKKKFEGLLDGKDYQFNKLKDIYELAINENGVIRRFFVDKYMFGNDYNLLVTVNDCWMPISLSNDKQIAKRVLNNPLYQLTQTDIKKMTSRISFSGDIIASLDMSNINTIKKKISSGAPGDELKFTETLKKIFGMNWNMFIGISMPRVRISRFSSVDDFTLVCDDKVRVPAIVGINPFLTSITINVQNCNKLFVQYGDNNFSLDI